MTGTTAALFDDVRRHLPKRARGSSFSRRQFIKAGATGLAVGGVAAKRALARGTRRRPTGFKRSKDRHATRPPPAVYDPVLLKLIDRTSFGFTRASYQEAEALGYTAYLEQQLAPETIDDSALDARLAVYDTLNMTSKGIYDTYSEQQSAIIFQLMEATTLRAIYSKRQLFERMVGFWTDHFNIDITDDLCTFLKTADDRDVIRQYALSTFPDLLYASAHSGAMLYYLDNYTNVVGNAQENYARELMELHTLGVDNGYTQVDVQEVARCLTGWTLYGQNSPTFGDAVFVPTQHDQRAKTVLGTYIPAGGGASDLDTVLNILANHPNTARFIAEKLCKRFIGYSPPEDIIETVKATYLATGGDIKEMLRAMLHQTFVTYMATPKFKRPFHAVASLLRATDAEVDNPQLLIFYQFVMGHAPFLWSPPNGYPDGLEEWSAALLPRWQYYNDVIYNFYQVAPNVTIDVDALLQSEWSGAPGEQAEAINRILTGGRLSPGDVALLQDFYDDGTPPGYSLTLEDSFGLAASLPGFQWY